MSKNIVVNVDYLKSSILGDINKALTKCSAIYKLLSNTTIPSDFALRENLLKDKEKMYLIIKNLNTFKQNITLLIKRYEAENSLAIDDILKINHFLLNMKK